MTDPAAEVVLTGSHVRLRAVAAADAPAIARLANDPDVARMTTSIPHPFALADAEGFIARMAAGDAERDRVFALERPGHGCVGVVGFHRREGPAPEIGYWLGRPHWGLGLMSEAVALALAWAGGSWAQRFIISGHFADNPASGRILCKCGFLYTGEVVHRHSIARGETAPTRMMVWLA